MPSLSTTPGLKLSMMTSAVLARRRKTSTPSGFFRSSTRPCSLRTHAEQVGFQFEFHAFFQLPVDKHAAIEAPGVLGLAGMRRFPVADAYADDADLLVTLGDIRTHARVGQGMAVEFVTAVLVE